MITLDLLLLLVGAALFEALAWAAVESIGEDEPRPAKLLFGLALMAPLPFLALRAVPGDAGRFSGAFLLAPACQPVLSRTRTT